MNIKISGGENETSSKDEDNNTCDISKLEMTTHDFPIIICAGKNNTYTLFLSFILIKSSVCVLVAKYLLPLCIEI